MMTGALWRIAAIVLAVLLLGAALAAGWQTWSVLDLRAALAAEKEGRAEDARAAAAAATAASQAAREAERRHATKQQEIADAFREDAAARERALAAARADADGLRAAAEAYASGGGQPSDSDSAACVDLRARAATLGKLLARLDGAAGRYAAAADRHADEVRALKRQVLAERNACVGGGGE